MPRPLRPVVVAFATWLAAAACGTALAGEPQAYALDPVHTRVLVTVEHAGFSKALGTVSGSTGTLQFDRDDWRSARLEVSVPLQRIDFGDAKWNAAVLAANLLDAERHPAARFVSTAVEPVDADHARVCGELTLRGVTGPLCLNVTLNALKRYPLPPFRRTAGFSACGTLSRKAFGIDAWPTVIGDTVTLRIEAEATRARDDEAPEPPEPTAASPATDTGTPPVDTPPEPDPQPTVSEPTP